MFSEMKVFAGYVWYAYPLDPKDKYGLMLVDEEKIPIRTFTGAEVFSNYHDGGVLIVTETPLKPTVSLGWKIVPCNVPDGFGGVVDGKVIRHIYTVVKASQPYSVFVSLKRSAEGGACLD